MLTRLVVFMTAFSSPSTILNVSCMEVGKGEGRGRGMGCGGQLG